MPLCMEGKSLRQALIGGSKIPELETHNLSERGVKRLDLRDSPRRLQGCCVQIVLREPQTLNGHPNRLHEWPRAAIEMAARLPEDEPLAVRASGSIDL
jgi:hypothetical protein